MLLESFEYLGRVKADLLLGLFVRVFPLVQGSKCTLSCSLTTEIHVNLLGAPVAIHTPLISEVAAA